MTEPEPVRDLTDEEYDKTYASGEPHKLPDDVLAELPGDREDVQQ